MHVPRPSLLMAAVLAVSTSSVGAALTLAQSASAPSVRPGDGSAGPAGRIAFGRVTRYDDFYGAVTALYAIDPDGSHLAQLTDGESAFPAWSPDGSRLAFTLRQPDGSWQIARVAADGTDRRTLTSGPGVSEVPSWSPDGTWIAYDYAPSLPVDDSFHTVLYRMDADGSHQQLLGDPATFDVEPRISPDGSQVLFERLTFPGGNEHNALMVRDLKSGAERTIAAAGDAVEHGNWSPDGKWIVYDVGSAMTDTVPKDQLEAYRRRWERPAGRDRARDVDAGCVQAVVLAGWDAHPVRVRGASG